MAASEYNETKKKDPLSGGLAGAAFALTNKVSPTEEPEERPIDRIKLYTEESWKIQVENEIAAQRKFEKTFDILDREVLWNLMTHYGIPQKFINIIRNSYNNMQCRVIHEGKLTESFDVKQGCLLSPFLFLLAIERVN
jgi:hypothetical protein